MSARSSRLGLECLESREMLSADGLSIEHLPQRWRGVTAMTPVASSDSAIETTFNALRSRFVQDRAGGTMSTAADLGAIADSHELHGRVGIGDQSDVFRFTIGQDSRVSLDLKGMLGNTNLALYNAKGQLVESSASGFRSEQLSASLAAGTYYAEVSAARSWFALYDLEFHVSANRVDNSPPPTVRPPVDRHPVATPPATSPPASTTPPTPEPPVDTSPQDPVEPAPLVEVPYYGGSNEWNLNTISAPEAWAAGATGQGVTVAVVDTGVDWRHVDLAANVWTNADEVAGDGIDNDGNGFVDDIRGWNFADANNNVTDTQGHGTHVAGTIAAGHNGFGATGVAHEATIMPVRVLGDDGSGSSTGVAAGIRYAVENGADIINLSLGGGFSYAIRSALDYALANDVLVVAAAGNESASTASFPAAHAATLSNVVSVGAHDRSGNRARFSNLPGSGVVQVDAPGVGIYSTVVGNRYGYMSGTSMAAPHVAGLAALALSRQPSLSASELRTKLASGATRGVGGSPVDGVNAVTTLSRVSVANTSTSLGSIDAELKFDDREDFVDKTMAMLASDELRIDGPTSPTLLRPTVRNASESHTPAAIRELPPESAHDLLDDLRAADLV